MIMIMKYDIYSLGIMVAVISFLGFSLENLWLSLTKGFIDNRNMNAPFLMGYGLLVVGMYLLLGTPEIWHSQRWFPLTDQRAKNSLYISSALSQLSPWENLFWVI